MIQEDYVSYEVAKLLKENGFDVPCRNAYIWNSGYELCTLFSKYINFNEESLSEDDDSVPRISAPTLQMAMKWLREVHKIIISFNASFVNSTEQHFSWNIRINSLKSLNDKEHFDPIYINTKSEDFKETAEAAVKYCLTNLI